jgi:agmatinase
MPCSVVEGLLQQLTSSQADSIFSGISTFGRLPYHPCLKSKVDFDIAFIGKKQTTPSDQTFFETSVGAPFDTGTSYRPGARFGPSGIRQGSRRLNL